jgi:hypothetical protein
VIGSWMLSGTGMLYTSHHCLHVMMQHNILCHSRLGAALQDDVQK